MRISHSNVKHVPNAEKHRATKIKKKMEVKNLCESIKRKSDQFYCYEFHMQSPLFRREFSLKNDAFLCVEAIKKIKK